MESFVNTLKETGVVLTAFAGLIGGFVAIFKYFAYRTRQDKMTEVREAFAKVVNSLSSKEQVERLAGAILLRRFYDAQTEVGIAGAPYAREAAKVATAVLRGEPTSTFQKLLADGLASAPTLEGADLQRVNLEDAYLGPRQSMNTNLKRADFFRANLTRASLKKADASQAQFYQARMQETVLKGADLTGANFFEADLRDAMFDGAKLTGANFRGARNLPPGLAGKLDAAGTYLDPHPFKAEARSAKQASVFFSVPGCCEANQQSRIDSLRSRLTTEGFLVTLLQRADYVSVGAMAEVNRMMNGCSGVVLFGFPQLRVHGGTWRASTSEQQEVAEMSLPTSWVQIEAGIAASLGLPMLVLADRSLERAGGVFDASAKETNLHRAALDDGWQTPEFLRAYEAWCAGVRERSR